MSRQDDLIEMVRTKSREIAPDYPEINTDLNPFQHLWAITSTYEGTDEANKEMHEYIDVLRRRLGMSKEEMVDDWIAIRNANPRDYQPSPSELEERISS